MTRLFLISFAITFAIYCTQAAPLSDEEEKPLINPFEDVVCERLNDIFTQTNLADKMIVELFNSTIKELEYVDNVVLRLRNVNEIYNETTDKLTFEINEIRKMVTNKNTTFSQEVMKNQQDLQNALEVFKSKTKKLDYDEARLTLSEIYSVRMYRLDGCQEVQLFIPIVKNKFAAYEHIDLEQFKKDMIDFNRKTRKITAEGRKLENITDDK